VPLELESRWTKKNPAVFGGVVELNIVAFYGNCSRMTSDEFNQILSEGHFQAN
jgi:hypothetical protein